MTMAVEAPEQGPIEVTEHAGSSRLFELIVRFRELGIVAALIIVVAATTIDNYRFVDETSLQQLLAGASIIALLSIGETVVIVTRGVDLSIGSILGLSAYSVGDIYLHHPHFSIPLVFLIALAIGAVCGVINGAIVSVAKVPSLVVTLGTFYAIRGFDSVWAAGNQVNSSNLPGRFNEIGYGTIGGVPYIGIIAVVAVAIGTYAMRTFRTGRDFYAIGSNPDAAALVGVPVAKRVFQAFVISGAIAGVTGALWLTYFGTVDSTAGTGYEFEVISAVVVGGVAIFGGSGTVLGAALGALLLNTINSALVVVKISSFWETAVEGALLLGAIAFDRGVTIRVARALRSRSTADVR